MDPPVYCRRSHRVARFGFDAAAAVSAVLLGAAIVTRPCPPFDLVRRDRESGFVYVGTAFGQLVVDVHTRGLRHGEHFGPNRVAGFAGIRLLRDQSRDRANRVVVCRVPLLLAAGLATPLPAVWAGLRWRRARRDPAITAA